MMRIPGFLSIALVLTLTGCFHYVPVEEVPRQGTAVRTYLSRPISLELTEVTANNVMEVRGEVVSDGADRVLLSAFGLRSASDFQHVAAGETVAIPRDAIERMEEKRISFPRTALAGAVLAGAGYLVQLGLRSAIGGNEGGETPPPPK